MNITSLFLDVNFIKEIPLNYESFLNVALIVIAFFIVFFALILIIRFSIWLFPFYPKTKWGFRAKLLYADDSGQKKIFRNKSYLVSVNPDLVFRLSNSKLAYVEFKSRTYVLDSDITQLEVGILALRGTYNVTRGAIALSNGEIHWVSSAKMSSRAIYKKNKTQINQVKSIRKGKWFEPIRNKNCDKCPMKKNCW